VITCNQKELKKVTAADQIIRDYYENEPPSESEAFRMPMETVSTAAQLAGNSIGSMMAPIH